MICGIFKDNEKRSVGVPRFFCCYVSSLIVVHLYRLLPEAQPDAVSEYVASAPCTCTDCFQIIHVRDITGNMLLLRALVQIASRLSSRTEM